MAELGTAAEKVLITGGQGFFGAWITKQLLEQGATPVIFDLKQDDHIMSQVLTKEQMAGLERHFGDISDTTLVTKVFETVSPTAVIHLAGLQVPTCKANPLLGARVNVLGTLNVFEAAKGLREKTGRAPAIVYASSAAVLGPPSDYATVPVPDDYYHKPRTIYGVFKLCNEGCARLYWQDHKLNSVGLRPYTCYGVGREIGLTSGPTKAIKSAVLGRPYDITFAGQTGFSYVGDIARIFIGCARAPCDGALAFNIRGEVTSVESFIVALNTACPAAKGSITCSGTELSIMSDTSQDGLEAHLKTVPAPLTPQEPITTPMVKTITETIELFKALQADGRLSDSDLPK